MLLPNHLIYYIAQYDYDLLCTLFYLKFKIHPEDCSFGLLKHIIRKHHSTFFSYCLQNNLVQDKHVLELFEYSVMYDSVKITKSICNQYVIPDSVLHEYAVYGIQENCLKVVYYMLHELQIPLDTNEYELLVVAIRNENPPLVDYLLNHPRLDEPSSGRNLPFLTAIECQNRKIFLKLLKHPKIDPHEPDNEPFRFALEIGNDWILETMLRNKWIKRTLDLDYDERARLRFILDYAS
jgi:hypothetical protein